MQTSTEQTQERRHLLIIELLRAHASVGSQITMAHMITDAKAAEAYITGTDDVSKTTKPLPCDET